MHNCLPRSKARVLLLTFIYRFFQPLLRPLSSKKRLALLLDLEWVFWRLAHEESFRFYAKEEHPTVISTTNFLHERLKPGSTILDLGCGVGKLSFMLASTGHQVVGIDHSADSLEIARRRYQRPSLVFENGDANDYLKQNNKKFDVLVLSHVLEHLDHPVDFLRNFASSFENIFIEVPDFEAAYLNSFRIHSGAKLTYTDDDHVIEFDRQELLRTVEEAGLKVAQQEFRFGVIRFWCSPA